MTTKQNKPTSPETKPQTTDIRLTFDEILKLVLAVEEKVELWEDDAVLTEANASLHERYATWEKLQAKLNTALKGFDFGTNS